jgi:hypothetical protein
LIVRCCHARDEAAVPFSTSLPHWGEGLFPDGGGSDALVAQGSPATVAGPLREHLDAGADQVAVQALGEDPIGELTALAPELGLGARARWI